MKLTLKQAKLYEKIHKIASQKLSGHCTRNTFLCSALLGICLKERNTQMYEVGQKLLTNKDIIKNYKVLDNGSYKITAYNNKTYIIHKASDLLEDSTIITNYKIGHCYKNAFNLALQYKHANYVIGTANHCNSLIPSIHAWVEFEDYVIDPSYNLAIKTIDFYKLFKAKTLTKNTHKEIKEDVDNKFYNIDKNKTTMLQFYLARDYILRKNKTR